ncbi:uncharacterized protein METZ01_LOCUS152272, partial [marine metagenome]
KCQWPRTEIVLDHCFVGRGGFEPPKANADGFTARSLWPLGHRPLIGC